MPLTITALTGEFVTLDEVKAHANVTGTEHDEELEMIQAAAQEHVEKLIGPVLWREVVQESHGRETVMLRTLPVISVDSIDGTAWTNEAYPTDLLLGAVTYLPTYVTSAITYTAGRTECPDAVRLATLIIAKHLWETQLGNSPTRGAFPTAEEAPAFTGIGFATPARALELLSPYMTTSGIA